ncbi:hypothetical protein [Marinicella rhabdoformis]|uniref:hypothetical protein n=1 Tax=Marinicella rhabdoformis TaxID=2580566 RepID=UPI0012AED826|nr:hypothetical protein [Marinicella rhabdoformis]
MNILSIMKWKPITKAQLEKEVETQCALLSGQELACFTKIRVPYEPVKIDRWGKLESVFIVARKDEFIVFYEDIEDGFEIGKLNEFGIIVEYGANQFTIQHVVNQLFASNSYTSLVN